MQVSTTTLQPIFEGVKQYIIPLFQRTYCWEKKHWEALWNDIYDLYLGESSQMHFMGSIVTIPTQTVPEGVAKFLIIDGQQRMTTFYILLLVLRDIASQNSLDGYAEEISETLLVNKFKKGQLDFYKLLPTQVDRSVMVNLVHSAEEQSDSSISSCYEFFTRQILKYKPDLNLLESLITKKLSLVSIVLDANDDPHIVFESLNYKGKPLSSSDLIRNYFFMKIHTEHQEQVYNDIWCPMQETLGEKLPDFVRHYLMKDGEFVNQKDVYASLKDKINKSDNAVSCMKDLKKYADFYSRLLDPQNEPDITIRDSLKYLNRLDMATSYTFLLNIYNDYAEGIIDKGVFCSVLYTLENYAIRRFICGVPTNQLNKVFPFVYTQMFDKVFDSYGYKQKLEGVLQSKNYPKDIAFRTDLPITKLYGKGRDKMGRTILDRIEQSFNHRENVQLSPPQIQIEHIMPQTLTSEWEIHLGDDFSETHAKYLNTIGNLALTGYNPELSNYSFLRKKEIYKNSHLELNAYFETIDRWDEDQIISRAEKLADVVTNKVYPYFGAASPLASASNTVTNTKPDNLVILGQSFPCNSWVDVLTLTLKVVSELEPEKLEDLSNEYPSLIGKTDSFRRSRQLANGYWFESNLSAKSIYVYCKQVINSLGLSEEDWQVSVNEN